MLHVYAEESVILEPVSDAGESTTSKNDKVLSSELVKGSRLIYLYNSQDNAAKKKKECRSLGATSPPVNAELHLTPFIVWVT